jgi:hypothetical protein
MTPCPDIKRGFDAVVPIVPGFVNAHTHLDLPFMGTYAKDTHETASKAALEKVENDLKTRGQPQREIYERMVEVSRVISPARAVAQTPFVRVAAQMFASDNAWNLEE